MKTMLIYCAPIAALVLWFTLRFADFIVCALMQGLKQCKKGYELRPYWPDVKLTCHKEKLYLVGGRWVNQGRFINTILRVKK